MHLKMKIQYIFILLTLTVCQYQNLQAAELKSENKILKDEMIQFENQNIINKKKRNTLVTLKNTDIREITSKFNNQKYQIKISYPKNYFVDKEKKYSVLYVIDAETNFGGISYIVQRLIKDKLIPEILVIGIAYNTDYKNFYKLRSRDLTPKNIKSGTGGALKFSKFIEYELFPYINKNFRTKKNEKAIYGHSYGGLFGTYILLNKPNLFNKYLLLSPSLWFNENMLLKQIEETDFDIGDNMLYMASGELEPRIDTLQAEFIKILKSKNIDLTKLKSEIKENETHRRIFGVGFTNGLRFLYKK